LILPTKLAGLPDATAVMDVFVQSGLFHYWDERGTGIPQR